MEGVAASLGLEQDLHDRHKLSAVMIDRLHERGLIYADDMQNAVFVRYPLTIRVLTGIAESQPEPAYGELGEKTIRFTVLLWVHRVLKDI